MRGSITFGALVAALTTLGCGSSPESGGSSDIEGVEPGSDVLEGKADSALGTVEVKFAIAAHDIDRALASFKLRSDNASLREIYFYDRADLALFDAGIILRARKLIDGADDSTVKLRPFSEHDIAASWKELDGFKCEEDRSLEQSVSSCSLSWRQDQGEIDAVAAGTRSVDKLFSSEQEQFVTENAPLQPSWSSLDVLGPAEASVWSVRSRRLDRKLTIEHWSLDDQLELLEVSTRTSESKADAVVTELADYLADAGIDVETEADGKTRIALEYFSGN